MNKKEIIEILEDNGLDNIKEIKKNASLFIVKFKYEFDDLELEGAESYAKDESSSENKDDDWYEEYYLPYLNDIAIDNVEDIIDEISEELNLKYEFISYELSKEQMEYIEFVAVFYEEDIDFNIDELILDL